MPAPDGDSRLSAEQMRGLAQLARLRLDDAERASLTREIGQILSYVGQLGQVRTEGVEPMAHALNLLNVFRDDEPSPSLSVDAALANALRRQGDFFAVPAVLD